MRFRFAAVARGGRNSEQGKAGGQPPAWDVTSACRFRPGIETGAPLPRAGPHQSISQGLNEGGDKVRTQVRRAMREQTSLMRLNSVIKRQATIRAFPGRLAYSILFKGKPHTRPDEFAYKVKTGPGGGVTVTMWGVAHRFQRSFQIAGMSGSFGLRARLSKDRLPIRGFDGPNLAKEAAKEDGLVATTFMSLSPILVPPTIEKRLARLL